MTLRGSPPTEVLPPCMLRYGRKSSENEAASLRPKPGNRTVNNLLYSVHSGRELPRYINALEFGLDAPQ
jgi:hypothetical protein